jgi:predicted nucleotidyltransferase
MGATEREQAARDRALSRVQAAVAMAYPQADVQLFGSLPAGLAVHCSDMDIVVLNLAKPAVSGFSKSERPRVMSKIPPSESIFPPLPSHAVDM